jgi:hypothetical protein
MTLSSVLKPEERTEISDYLPAIEIDLLHGACLELFRKWEQAAPTITDWENPEGIQTMDQLIRNSLVQVAKSGIEKPLMKLAIVSVWIFKPETRRDRSDPGIIVASALYKRLGDSDTYLTELRDLRARAESKDWTIYFRDLEGNVVHTKPRTFPYWAIEEDLGLDSYDKALAFYLGECKTRKLV